MAGESSKAATTSEAGTLAPSDATVQHWLDKVKNPAPWLTLGGDLRLRQVYFKNAVDFLDEFDDTRQFFRIRARLSAKFGPFMADESLNAPNGLSFYLRVNSEPRYLVQRAPGTPAQMWEEVVLDNAYIDWQRIGGAPVSVRAGRQDIIYGRGWIILDGTPLDGSRTIYMDAIKASVHLDDWKSQLDLFYMDNKGRQSRIHPINDQDSLVTEFDASVFGAYLINKACEGHEFNVYYVYKDEDPLPETALPGRIVHTAGALAQGKLAENWDYYGEGAYQWGKEGTARRRAWGVTGEVGYTFADCAWKTRLHGGYEYLSGDDPSTGTYEAWDTVLGRWPHWSELYAYRWAMEGGMPGAYTNLQRFTLGGRTNPTDKLCLHLNYNYLLANEHTFGKTYTFPAGPYDSGNTRGHLIASKATYDFNKNVSAHLWAEYFTPGDYYDSEADDAVFLRWQLMFKF